MEFTFSKTVAVALLTMGLVASSFGGPIIYWDNDNGYSAPADPLYVGSNSPVALSAGVGSTAGDGDLLQLVALVAPLLVANNGANDGGVTNFVLDSITVGDDPLDVNGPPWDGYFGHYSTISGSILDQVWGDPMGVVFYDGTTTNSPHALVYNNSITVPSSDDHGYFRFELDYGNLNFVGPRTAAGNPKGWFVEDSIPEPSTMMLVGLGLLGAVGLRRRRS